MSNTTHYINGQWAADEGDPLTSIDPATGTPTWRGAAASPNQIDHAVTAANRALHSWSRKTLNERENHVRAFQQQLESSKTHLAEMISRDTGKPLWESSGEVGAMIGKVQLSIDAYTQRRSPISFNMNGATASTRYKPYGVCAVFGPFNLPGHLPNGHILPALLAGNTVVFKPSELAPGVGHATVELWDRAGLPTGVLNMIQGGPHTGANLSRHDGIDSIFFTGSSATGLRLAKQWADLPWKMLALEMGGNNPLVVWDAADTKAAAYLTIQSAYITAGQRCTCARRLIIPQGGAGDTLIDQLVKMIGATRTGYWTNRPEPFIGPVISTAAAECILEAQHNLISAGANPIVAATNPDPNNVALISPGLIDVTGLDYRADTEVFGPLLQLIRVPDFSAAVQEANNTTYGLAAALLSDRRELYDRFDQQVRAGVVNWNRQTTDASGRLPFGGIGASGNNRPSGYWAADYCSYPVASIENERLAMPNTLRPGINITT